MQINGKLVTAGTIVIAPGETGSIPVPPLGEVPLRFVSDGGVGRIDTIDGHLTVFNMETPVGAAATPTFSLPGGGQGKVRLAVYSVGEGDAAYRVVHFTVSA